MRAKSTLKKFAIILAWGLFPLGLSAQSILQLDPPIFNQGKISEWNLISINNQEIRDSLLITVNQQFEGKARSVLQSEKIELNVDSGLQKINLAKTSQTKISPSYNRPIDFLNNLPPGQYEVELAFKEYVHRQYWQVDSQLSKFSIFEDLKLKGINRNLKKSIPNGIVLSPSKLEALANKKKKVIDNPNKIYQKLIDEIKTQIPSVDFRDVKMGRLCQANLYQDDIFLGHWNIDLAQEAKELAESSVHNAKKSARSRMQSETEGYNSLMTDFKKQILNQSKDNEYEGEVRLDNYFSNDQMEYSLNENIYSEVGADLEAKILGIPVQMQGFYTTQDKNRKIKASYFRIQYDLAAASDDIQENIDQFKNEYRYKKAELKSKTDLYDKTSKKLQNKKGVLLHKIRSLIPLDLVQEDIGSMIKDPKFELDIDTAQIVAYVQKLAEEKVAKDSNLQSKKIFIEEKKKEIIANIEKAKKMIETARELKTKIESYKKQFDALQQNFKIDSAFVMDKLKDKSGLDDLSQASLIEKGKEILPQSSLAKRIRNINQLDIGILNRSESRYTLDGQLMKGAGIGYQIGSFDIGVAGGRTEYVSRDLQGLEKYNTAMLRVANQISDDQKIKLILYSYASSSADSNFNLSSQLSGLDGRTDIASLSYDARLGSANIHAESAQSINRAVRNLEKESTPLFKLDDNASNISLGIPINKIGINSEFEYERIGKNFTNNSLSFLRRDIQMFKAGLSGTFLKGYLFMKVNLYELFQGTVGNGRENRRLGFLVQTRSKRYPNIRIDYKPFTTFNSLNDTINIAQRQLFGEVLSGKISYQLKGKTMQHRWNVLINRNESNIDTISYRTSVYQLSYILSTAKLMASTQIGRMEMPTNLNALNSPINNFIRTTEQFKINRFIQSNISTEIAWHQNQVNRLGLVLGCAFNIPNKPLQIRVNGNLMQYRNQENINKSIYGGHLGLSYQFKSL